MTLRETCDELEHYLRDDYCGPRKILVDHLRALVALGEEQCRSSHHWNITGNALRGRFAALKVRAEVVLHG